MDDVSGLKSGSATGRRDLPVLGAAPPERADAARNRRRVLDAAARLHAEHGVAGLNMDDVAAAAGVGKGTVYRRFVDKSGLAGALLDDRGRQLHERLLYGPPPLGPGAPGEERLVAFVAAYIEHSVRSLDLVLLSETGTPGGRLAKPVYGFWRLHVEVLLRDAGAPDPRTRAEALLAVLSAEQLQQWTQRDGRTVEELSTTLGHLARSMAT
ncbi:TetR/AcrR family transcriptional regulator [Cryptosporangium aurantiacum]|uniref:Transcriptional regulator, TetR family n=1 Tax=Cryptosporangium aurantiacum TaxID=134849 RepID=A0A1M7RN92_9ACTN|nr:TetR/AcrR family transcriptional regulator [Cryptosporangium aurantiacum]SHN47714.1 transcriptional regulator, TetR family [Cryptosporangium aurantiacum]